MTNFAYNLVTLCFQLLLFYILSICSFLSMKRESDPDSVVLTQTWKNDTPLVVSFCVKYFHILLYGILQTNCLQKFTQIANSSVWDPHLFLCGLDPAFQVNTDPANRFVQKRPYGESYVFVQDSCRLPEKTSWPLYLLCLSVFPIRICRNHLILGLLDP